MDADDIASPPDQLKFHYDFLAQNPNYGVVTGQVVFGGDTQLAAGLYRYTEWVNSLKTAKPENSCHSLCADLNQLNPQSYFYISRVLPALFMEFPLCRFEPSKPAVIFLCMY